MSTQFVACTAEDCPLNEARQCRAPFIAVDDEGKCLIRENGPHEDKSSVEKYVKLSECACEGCHHWERDAATQKGDCGYRQDLFFSLDDKKEGPFCSAYKNQVNQPSPFTTLV